MKVFGRLLGLGCSLQKDSSDMEMASLILSLLDWCNERF